MAKRVPVEEFCGVEAERRLEDPAWVTPRAVEHGRVIAEAFRRAPVLPMRFATLFSSAAALDEFIAANAAAIGSFLNDAREREEWGIKGTLERARLKSFLLAANTSASPDAISPGQRYLRERRAEHLAEKQMSGWLERACDSVEASLSGCAVDTRRRKIIEGADAETILNLAAFVPRGRVPDLRRQIDELNAQLEARGLVLRLTGPWPPYSFCPPLDIPR